MLTMSNTVFHALHESRYLHNILIKYINAFRKLQSESKHPNVSQT